MQSAFEVENGKRFIFETTPITITVYHCNGDWQKISEFASFNLMSPEQEYHTMLGKGYLPECFVEQQSTIIDNYHNC
jgi:hypothetical protein